MIEEKLESLIERYTIEIEDEIKNLKKYKDELENVLKESDCLSEVDNSRISHPLFVMFLVLRISFQFSPFIYFKSSKNSFFKTIWFAFLSTILCKLLTFVRNAR